MLVKRKSDWLPTDGGELLGLAKVWIGVLTEVHAVPNAGLQTNAAAWGVPVEKAAALIIESNRCSDLLEALKDPDAASVFAEVVCRKALERLELLMRDLHGHFYRRGFPRDALARLVSGEERRKRSEDRRKNIRTGHKERRSAAAG
jgi:hypothetical protein